MDDERIKNPAGIPEGRRDVNAIGNTRLSFGYIQNLGSVTEVSAGWAETRGMDDEGPVPTAGYSGIVNKPEIFSDGGTRAVRTAKATTKSKKLIADAVVAREIAIRPRTGSLGDEAYLAAGGPYKDDNAHNFRPHSYTGLVAKYVQLLLGLPRKDIGRVKAITGDLTLRYDWGTTHGLYRRGSSLWLITISRTSLGVTATRFVFQNLSPEMRDALAAKGKAASEGDVLARMVALLGGIPSSVMPAGGVEILPAGAMGDFASAGTFTPEIGWAFNSRGTEAHVVGMRYISSLTAWQTMHLKMAIGYDIVLNRPTATLSTVAVGPPIVASTCGLYTLQRHAHGRRLNLPNMALLPPSTPYVSVSSASALTTTADYAPLYVAFDEADNLQVLRLGPNLVSSGASYNGYCQLAGEIVDAYDGTRLPMTFGISPTVPKWGVLTTAAVTGAGIPAPDTAYFATFTPWSPAITSPVAGPSGYPAFTSNMTGSRTAAEEPDGIAKTYNFTFHRPAYVISPPGGTTTWYEGTDGISGTQTNTQVVSGYQVFRRAFVQRGGRNRIAVLEVKLASYTEVKSYTWGRLTSYDSAGRTYIGTDTLVVTRTYQAHPITLTLHGGPLPVVIPISFPAEKSPFTYTSTVSQSGFYPYSAGSSGGPTVVRSASGDVDTDFGILDPAVVLETALNALPEFLASMPLYISSATRTGRWVKLTALTYNPAAPLKFDPTYAESLTPAAAANTAAPDYADAALADNGLFTFFGDY